MLKSYKYSTEEEKNLIIESQLANGFYLIEEQNISEGNFLIFGTGTESTNPEPTETQILMDFIVDVDYRVSRLELGM